MGCYRRIHLTDSQALTGRWRFPHSLGYIEKHRLLIPGGSVEHIDKITRQSIYEEVWAEPVSQIAPRYGISGVALGKVCRKYKIPLPPRGYWAKVRAGHLPKKAPLPTAKKFDDCSLPLSRSPTHDPDKPGKVQKSALTAKDRVGFIDVAEELQSPHPLIRAASGTTPVCTGGFPVIFAGPRFATAGRTSAGIRSPAGCFPTT
jgi:hypothetical protein